MACECIKMLNAKLREDTGDPEAEVKTPYSFVGENGIFIVKDFIPIQVLYRQKKKDGTLGRKKTGTIKGAYCPICGKKL